MISYQINISQYIKLIFLKYSNKIVNNQLSLIPLIIINSSIIDHHNHDNDDDEDDDEGDDYVGDDNLSGLFSNPSSPALHR